jgi:GT2 family glycosyltransferase
MFKNKVIVGITTFRREKELIDLVKKIKNYFSFYLKKIIIFDNYHNSNLNVLLKDFTKFNINVLPNKKPFLDYSSLNYNLISLIEKSKFIYLRNKKNIGGSGGIGALQYIFLNLKGNNILWLIDDDSDVDKNTLKELLKKLRLNNQLGIIGSTIINNQGVVQETGCFLKRDKFEFIPINYLLNKNKLKEERRKLDYVSFTSVIIKKEVVKKIGVMKNFFIHVDDAEYCFRAKKYGFKISVSLKSFIYNKNIKKQEYSTYDLRNYLFLANEFFSLKEKVKLFINIFRDWIYSFFFNRKAFKIITKSFCLFLFNIYGKIEE